MELQIATADGRHGLNAILHDRARALLAFDYDGTLAPIVPDPEQAAPHPRVVGSLVDLASHVGTVAIITGRPARVAVRLAGLAGVAGLEGFTVLGHYGLERWDAASDVVQTAEPPPGLSKARAELPGLLSSLRLGAADIEDKGLSVAVHVRRLPDGESAAARLDQPLRELAGRCGLVAEPGRLVVELRPPGMDKGQALRRLVAETAARSVAFAGDDLGDLAAFAEIDRMRRDGLPGLKVCSGSVEQSALCERADLVVHGPEGIVGFMDALVTALRQSG